MSTEDPLTITLSPETSRKLRLKIVENGYTDAEDFIQAALDSFEFESDGPEFERFLREEVIPACEEYDRDPSTARTSEQVQATLDAAYHRALKAG